jgi:hypothetical protein
VGGVAPIEQALPASDRDREHPEMKLVDEIVLHQSPVELPELMAQVAALLRARHDLSADEANYLQEALAVAMRRFTDERASWAR